MIVLQQPVKEDIKGKNTESTYFYVFSPSPDLEISLGLMTMTAWKLIPMLIKASKLITA